jgi:hypothetical protein
MHSTDLIAPPAAAAIGALLLAPLLLARRLATHSPGPGSAPEPARPGVHLSAVRSWPVEA